MRGKGRVEIIVESPTVHVVRNPDGHMRLPTWKTSGTPGKPRVFDVHLVLRNGTVELPEPLGAVTGLTADALVSTGTQTHRRDPARRLGVGSVRDPRPALSADGERGRQRAAHDPAAHHARDLAFAGRAEWRKGSGERRVHMDVERLSWRWLAKVTGNKTFDVPGEAQATIDGLGDRRWQGRFDSHLAWNDLPMTGDGGFTWTAAGSTCSRSTRSSAAGELRAARRGRAQDGRSRARSRTVSRRSGRRSTSQAGRRAT